MQARDVVCSGTAVSEVEPVGLGCIRRHDDKPACSAAGELVLHFDATCAFMRDRWCVAVVAYDICNDVCLGCLLYTSDAADE